MEGVLMFRNRVAAPGTSQSYLPLSEANKYDPKVKTSPFQFKLIHVIGVTLILGILVLCAWLGPAFSRARNAVITPDFEDEKVFPDSFQIKDNSLNLQYKTFPNLLQSPPEVFLSVIVPAYNEEERMSIGIGEMVNYLQSQSYSWELILVDDGSKDHTHYKAITEYLGTIGSDRFRVLKLHQNSGKGAALRKGFMRARGEYILMADADGATRFSDVEYLFSRINAVESNGYGIVFGSRAQLGEEDNIVRRFEVVTAPDHGTLPPFDVVIQRSFFRRILQKGFHTAMAALLGPPLAGTPSLPETMPVKNWKTTTLNDKSILSKRKQTPEERISSSIMMPSVKEAYQSIIDRSREGEIADTQCGFKLFTRAAAGALFSNLHIERWAFDVELVYLARAFRIPITEVNVKWHEVGGSKVNILKDSVEMLRDVTSVRVAYTFGWWKADPPKFAY